MALAESTLVSIYALRDPRTGEVRYVGKAQDPRRRFMLHVSPFQLSYYKSHKNSWLKGLLSAGLKPELLVIEVMPAEQANERERYWIAHHRAAGSPLTNGTEGGDGGTITDPDAKARIRAAHVGRVCSDETKRKMSETSKRVVAEKPGERERLRAIATSPPPVHVGEKNPRAKLTDVQVRELRVLADMGEDLRALAREFGITPASVTQLVTGKFRKSAGGPTREARPRSVLTDDDVTEIRRLVGIGVSQSEVARRFGVDPSHVCKTVRGQRRRMDTQ